jgi:hypothetical protein
MSSEILIKNTGNFMQKIIIAILVLGSMSAFASSKEKVSIEIKADSKDLCQFTSDSVFKGDVEGDFRQAGGYVKSVTACNKGLNGKFRKSIQFIMPTQNR